MKIETIDEKLRKKGAANLQYAVEKAHKMMMETFEKNGIAIEHNWSIDFLVTRHCVSNIEGKGDIRIKLDSSAFLRALFDKVRSYYIDKFQQAAVDEFMKKLDDAKRQSDELAERVEELSEYQD